MRFICMDDFKSAPPHQFADFPRSRKSKHSSRYKMYTHAILRGALSQRGTICGYQFRFMTTRKQSF